MAQREVLIGVGAVALGAAGLATAHAFGLFDAPKKKGKRGSPDIEPEPEPEPVALEPWEEEAELVDPVNGGMIDAPTEPHELAVGRGHPEAFVVPLPDVVENPRKANAKEAPWKAIDPLTDERFAPIPRSGVPFAPVGAASTWPVITRSSGRLITSYRGNDGWHGYSGRSFNADRETDEGEVRRHAGVDLWGREGDKVVAPEDARVLAILPFHHGTWSVYLITPDRRVINLGEVAKFSWRDFDVRPGMEVKMGQPVARVGLQTHGSTMIHYEMYDGSGISDDELADMIRSGGFQWPDEQNPPSRLYDPTAYLLTAASRTYRREQGLELAKDEET